MPTVASMTKYWGKHPPVHILVAGYMGYKPETQSEAAPNLDATIAELAADFGDDLPPHLRGALDSFVSTH
jgi:hypothetical protein